MKTLYNTQAISHGILLCLQAGVKVSKVYTHSDILATLALFDQHYVTSTLHTIYLLHHPCITQPGYFLLDPSPLIPLVRYCLVHEGGMRLLQLSGKYIIMG